MNYALYDERMTKLDKNTLHIILELFDKTKDRNGIIKTNDYNIKYDFIAKGGQGEVYGLEVDNNIIAVKRSKKINQGEKTLLELMSGYVKSHICPNFLLIYNIETINHKDYIMMEKINGNLNNWLAEHHTDDEWMSFLFQFLISVYIMKNYAKTYHSDLKPKNILFREITTTGTYIQYKFKENTYNIPVFSKLFIIGDFGHADSLLINPKSEKVKKALNENKDFEHIYTLAKRIQVDNIIKNYNSEKLIEIFKKHKIDYKEYYDLEEKRINTELRKYPQHIKNDMLCKSMAYYIIENKLYDKLEFKNKSKMILPSNKIQKFIENNFDGNKDSEVIITKNYNNYMTESKNIIGKFILA